MCIAEKRQTNSRDKKQLDAHQPENVQHAYVWCTHSPVISQATNRYMKNKMAEQQVVK